MRKFLPLLLALGVANAEERPTVAAVLRATPEVAGFLAALEKEGVLATLEGEGPFTVLAPIDAALEGRSVDGELLARHVFAGRWTTEAAERAGSLANSLGDAITFARSGEAVRAMGVGITRADLLARNGVVHMIDGVLPIPIRVEASLPEGFPEPGPAGEVTLKEYPRYRAARAAGGGSSFWTLFRHIKKHDIAMTAPVEMSMEEGGGRFDMTAMAFLYGSAEMGEAGRDGDVEVVDLGPARVLSFGLFGPLSDARVKEARRAIEERIGRDGLARAGGWRLLGYNSPMVPERRRFYEVQIPVAAP